MNRSCSSPVAIPSAPQTGEVNERIFRSKITGIDEAQEGMEEEERQEDEEEGEETEEETEEVLNVDSNIIGLEVWHEIVAKQTPHPLKKG